MGPVPGARRRVSPPRSAVRDEALRVRATARWSSTRITGPQAAPTPGGGACTRTSMPFSGSSRVERQSAAGRRPARKVTEVPPPAPIGEPPGTSGRGARYSPGSSASAAAAARAEPCPGRRPAVRRGRCGHRARRSVTGRPDLRQRDHPSVAQHRRERALSPRYTHTTIEGLLSERAGVAAFERPRPARPPPAATGTSCRGS